MLNPFSFHPFANIGSAVLKLNAIRLATREETHCLAIDYGNVFQIQDDVLPLGLAFKKLVQFRYRLFFDAATEDEYHESPARRSLNLESHRSGHFTHAAVGLAPRCGPSSKYRPSTVQPGTHPYPAENRYRRESLSDRILGNARIPGVERGDYRKVCFLISSCLIFKSSVERGIPSLAAAPFGPATFPSLSARAASMSSFS